MNRHANKRVKVVYVTFWIPGHVSAGTELAFNLAGSNIRDFSQLTSANKPLIAAGTYVWHLKKTLYCKRVHLLFNLQCAFSSRNLVFSSSTSICYRQQMVVCNNCYLDFHLFFGWLDLWFQSLYFWAFCHIYGFFNFIFHCRKKEEVE